jgi:hypothetical protein
MPGVALTICSLLIAPLKATTVLFRNIPCKSLSGPSDNIEIPFDVVRRTTSPADICADSRSGITGPLR